MKHAKSAQNREVLRTGMAVRRAVNVLRLNRTVNCKYHDYVLEVRRGFTTRKCDAPGLFLAGLRQRAAKHCVGGLVVHSSKGSSFDLARLRRSWIFSRPEVPAPCLGDCTCHLCAVGAFSMPFRVRCPVVAPAPLPHPSLPPLHPLTPSGPP